MKKSILGLAIATIFSSTITLAEQPSFNYIEGGYNSAEDLDGLIIRGSVEITDNLYVTGSYTDSTDDKNFSSDLDTQKVTAGVGFKVAMNDYTALYAELEYLDQQIEIGSFDESDDGHAISLGMRSMIVDGTELYGEIANVEFNATSTELALGIRQALTDNFGVFAEYNTNDFDVDGYTVGASFKF